METGRKIEEVAKKIHPDCILTIPLYRSCVVILKQDKKEKERGYCTILLYHDPQWRSEKITKETLQYYKDELVLHGQRSGFELWLNKGVLNVDIKETIEEIMEEK